MRSNHKLFGPCFGALFLLALANTGVHAQTQAGAAAPAFYIAEFELTDPEGIKPYSAGVQSTLAPFGGRFVVRGGPISALEGEPARRMVVIAFDSVKHAQAWYDSPAYAQIRPIRHRSAKTRAYIVEGMPQLAGSPK